MYQKQITFLGGKAAVDLDEVLNYQRDEEEEVEDADFSPSVKRKVLLACLFALAVGNMMMFNVAAFLPSFIELSIKNDEWDH